MKKVLTILAILMLSFAGVFVGCNEGKYANAEVVFESSALSGDVLTIGYNNSVDISAYTTGVKDINPAVNFTCSDTEALEFTGLSNTKDGTKVTVKAKKPTYGDNYFVLKAVSVETSNVYKEIKVKVILPIEGIDFGGAVLAVSPSTPLRLFEYVQFYPQTPYVTNQKEVVYDITNYGLNNPSSIKIDNTGLITVSDDIVDNLITDSNCLEVTVMSLANRGIQYTVKINVIRELTDNDISFESTQLSYNKAPTENKKDLILFTNSSKYYTEQVAVEIVSSQDIEIIPEKYGNVNVVEIKQLGNITKTPIDGVQFKNKAIFEIRTKSSADSCQIKFRVKILNIDSPLEFNFSNDTAINIKTSALPKAINLKQDVDTIDVGQTIAVYNEYVTTENTSNHGTRLVPSVTSNSATSVSEANKRVKIELLSMATFTDAMSEFIFTDIRGDEIETINGYIEMLSNNGFYLKAKEQAVGKTFKLVITTQIEEFISYATGGSPSVENEQVVAEYYITANYGVREITFEHESYVTKLYTQASPEYTETIVRFTVNENADITGMVAEYDPTVLSVTRIDTFTYLITGNLVATTDFAIVAKNGYTKRVVVKVVDPLTSAYLSVDNPAASQIITETAYYAKNLISVSAKTGGRFSVYVTTSPSKSGVIKTEFESTDGTVAVVSGSGIVSTKKAGSTMITAKIQYYEFTYGADGYAIYEIKTKELSFDLTVFTPTRSITLSRNAVTVYSYDSLGYDYKDYSVAEIYAVITPDTATIYGDEEAVSYELFNNNGILVQEGAKGRYRATLPTGVNEATVIVVVTVSEFGTSVSLVCTVTVLRAVQVEEITIDNLERVMPEKGHENEQQAVDYFLDMKEGEAFTLEITLNPEKVFVSDLLIALYDDVDGEPVPVTGPTIATVDGRTIISKAQLESFDPINLFIRIYAKDSMYTEIEGFVYITIYLTIETGSIDSPYLIETPDELQSINGAPTKHYMLKNDIDLSGRTWEPIQNFSGSINGLYYRKAGETVFAENHKIIGLTLSSKEAENIGLFANTTITSLIFNLEVAVGSAIISNNNNLSSVGALVGVNEGLILNCAVSLGNGFIVEASSDAVSGSVINVGGMVGTNKGYVYNFAPFGMNDDGEFTRLYTAKEIEDVSVPEEYIDIVGTSDSFLNISIAHSEGALPSSKGGTDSIDMAEVNMVIDALTSANPVSGRLVVRDVLGVAANYGGLVGYNEGYINGVYGLYHAQEESSYVTGGNEEENEFLLSNTLSATFNSEGRDVSVNIGPNGVSLRNMDTTAGGIVGMSVGGGIYNVASSGKVEGYYNVGGIVGKLADDAVLDTASSSARITGNEKVGGAIGYALGATINLVKVENYQETLAGGEVLIKGNHDVGGVVGLMEESTMTFAYAVSFVDQSTFTTGAATDHKADIYNNGNASVIYVGGVVGHLSSNSELQFVYSTLSIFTRDAQDQSYAGGIAGAMEQTGEIYNAYYIGQFVRYPRSKTGSIVGLLNATSSTSSPVANKIRYAFAKTPSTLEVVGVDTKGFFNTSDGTVIKNVTSQSAIDSWQPAAADNWEKNTGLNIKDKIDFPVIKYESKLFKNDVYFIKQTPTAVEVKVSDAGAGDEFIKINDTVLLLTHSANVENNEYRIKDLLKFTWQPSSIKSSSLRVSSSAVNIIDVAEDGVLVVKGSGTVTLTFTSVLNLNVSCSVTIVVVPKISGVALYSDANLTVNLLEGSVLDIKKGTNQKLYPVYYDIDKDGNKIKVNTGYYADYSLTHANVNGNTVSNEFISVNKSTNIITALKETETNQVVSFTTYMTVNYTIDGNAQPSYIFNPFLTYPNGGLKTFAVAVYTGATDLIVNPNSGKELTPYSSEYLEIDLVSDAKVDGVLLEIIDDEGNVISIEGNQVKIGENYYSLLGTDSEGQQALDKIGFMLNIKKIVTDFTMGIDVGYHATLCLEIDPNKKYYTEAVGYTFRFTAKSNNQIVRNIRVVVVPQIILTMEDNYRVLENSQISESGVNSFIFQEKPVDKIVPGKIGLISLNVFPDYAGVEYYTIETTPEAMPYVNFAQLYKDNSTRGMGMSYIFGRNAEVIPNGLKLNRLSNYKTTRYTYTNGTVVEQDKILDVEQDNNTTDIESVEHIYEFDGNLYIELLTSNSIYNLDKFPVWITAVYKDGSKLVYEREFETTYLPAITFETTRNYISLGTRGTATGGLEKDYVDVSVKVDGDYDISITYAIIKDNQNSGLEGVATLSETGAGKGRITLSQNAQPGDIIRLTASYTIAVEGRLETVSATTDIMVVEAVIDEFSIEKAVDNKILFTISSAQQLQATLKGCAEETVLSRLSTIVSRQMTSKNTIAYWKYVYNNGEVTNLDNRALALPFAIDVKKVSTADDGEGLASISLVGSSISGSANLMLRLYVYYDSEGKIHFGEVIDQYSLFPQLIEVPFVAQVIVDSTDDVPNPIYTLDDLMSMADGGNYILMNDLDINTPFTPITRNIASFDGNNKIITISNFAYESSADAVVSSAINLGLFGTVYEGSVIKNVIVALPNDKENPMMLNHYSNINLGGIAGINNGIITNCDVISIYDKETYDSYQGMSSDVKAKNMYAHLGYTYNIYTAVQYNGSNVTVNVGGLVGQNTSTGIITNSRVGRNYVEYVEIEKDDYNGTTPNLQIYEYVAPVTIFKLEGAGNIGGFAGSNEGVISNSYFGNGQLEIASYGTNYTRTGGFAAVNSGAIYSSYVAGWEEEDYLEKNEGDGSGKTLLSKDPTAGGEYYTVDTILLNPNRKLGGGVYSNGNIGGFVYVNSGFIQNCYSNINLSGDYSFAANRSNISTNVILTEYGNLNAGGFVYSNINDGSIITSYSISKVKSNISTHGPFVGVSSSSGDVQNDTTATVDKCYYLIEKDEQIYNADDPAHNISQTNDAASSEEEGEAADSVTSIGNEFIITDTFAGFSFDNEKYSEGMQSGAVWAIKTLATTSSNSEDGQNDYGYPELIAANKVAISVRVLKPNAESMDGDADYSYVYALGYEKGSDINPQIITSASDYNKIFENILNVTVPFENVNVKYTGNLRLVNNIDFSTLTPASSSFEYTSPINGKSVFDGNNLVISNILLGDESETNTAFGLFKVLNGVGVKNITLTIRTVDSTNGIAVGGLAGIIVESDINNITVGAAIEGAEISGQNYVGGLAGIIVSGDDFNLNQINNISVNVSVLAGYNSLNSQNIIKPGEIWSLIIPPARINKFSSDYNLRLQYLKNDVSYAGGIAGVIDLRQAFKVDDEEAEGESLDIVNVRALTVANLKTFVMPGITLYAENATSVEAGYAGGLFGFVGNETFIREASFEAYSESGSHYISGDIAAGGIAAINYGFIDQTEVTYDKTTQKSLDNYLENFVKGTKNITWGNQSLYSGTPTYLGGIVGINIGGDKNNTGTIQNSYNRIDLVNSYATRIGGIAGASHVGAFVNVYTTANIVGDFSKEVSYFGAIVGQLLNNTNNNYYTISLSKYEAPAHTLEFTNVTVATIWNPQYYDMYEAYTNTYGIETYEVYRVGDEFDNDTDANGDYIIASTWENKFGEVVVPTEEEKEEPGAVGYTEIRPSATFGKFKISYGQKVVESKGRIGALYGAPTSADTAYDIQGEILTNPYEYYDFYVVKFSGDNVILQTKMYEDFTAKGRTLDLFCGVQRVDPNDTDFVSDVEGGLHYYLTNDLTAVPAYTLTKEEMNDLYTLEVGTTSNAKDKAFSSRYWSARVWNFEETERLISLNYGYIPSVVRIFTAEDYVKEIHDSPGSKKYYYIMNDIDFKEIPAHKIQVPSNFRGTIVGVKQWSSDKEYSRYPILYNISLSDETAENNFSSEKIALFHTTTNASFINFNIVISNWNEKFDVLEDRPAFVKRTAVFIATANATSISNVNIGYRLSHFTGGILTEGTSEQESIMHEVVSNGITNQEYLTVDIGLADSFRGIKTYGTYFGGIIAEGISSSIKNCSFNVPVEIVYKSHLLTANAEIYAGGISGKMIGTVAQCYVTRNFCVYTDSDTSSAQNIYIGGAIGHMAGVANNIGFGNPEVNENSSFISNWRKFFADQGPSTDRGNLIVNPTIDTKIFNQQALGHLNATNELYIGGVIGYATDVKDVVSSVEAKVESLYNYNTVIDIKTKGKLTIGGVIGKNDIQATWLQYKNKELSSTGIFVYANDNTGSVYVGGIVGDNACGKTFANVYTNVNVDVNNTEKDGIILSVGGIIGIAHQSFLLSSVLNESTNLTVYAQKGICYVGGILGSSVSTSATNMIFDYVISTTYVKYSFDDGSSTLYIGGLIGYVKNNGVTIVNAASLGNLYIGKSAQISSLRAGGIVGEAKHIKSDETGYGIVVACNINYQNIGAAATFKIGPLAGNLTNPDDASYRNMCYSENLFGLYLNSYCDTLYNLKMEDLADRFHNIFIQNSAGDFGSYLQGFRAGASQTYGSNLTSLIVFNNSTKKFGGVSGSKLNPIALNNSNVDELATTTYTYYKMNDDIAKTSHRDTAITDINIHKPLERLGQGNFVDARGHSIIVNLRSLPTKISNKYIFETIEEEAFLVGLLVEKAAIMDSDKDACGIIAKTNWGTILGCGTASNTVTRGISANKAAGIVGLNRGNVINCFSIANVTARDGGSAAGLVHSNRGNIITSYYTGNIYAQDGDTTNKRSGLVYSNKGNIANCYTMANIIDVASSAATGALFIENSGTILNTYFDINAYVGDDAGYINKSTQGKTTAQLSSLGEAGGPTIEGNWFSSKDNQLKTLYMKAYSDQEVNVYITSAWFNYSYSVANVNGNISTVSGIRRFLNMIYTGNGKPEPAPNASDREKYTNNFYNGPYRITNAGMIESYFLTANAKTESDKSYYILQNDISFKSYAEWSATWNAAKAAPIVFTGDFNGNGKLMHSIASSQYGIFRSLGSGANLYNFSISNIKSQTGLIAGAMSSGATIDDISIISKSEPANNYGLCEVNNTGIDALYTNTNDTLYRDMYLAGGVVAYMKGGDIKRVSFEGTDLHITSIIKSGKESYCGGVVAYAEGGTIDLSGSNAANHQPFANCNVFVTGYIAGGMIGYSKISINNYLLINTVVNGSYIAGGFIGKVSGSALTYENLNNAGVIFETLSTSAKGGIIGESDTSSISAKTTIKNCHNSSDIKVNKDMANSCAGGLVGRAAYIELISSESDAGGQALEVSGYCAGGLVGRVTKSIELKESTIANINQYVTINATQYAGGVVGFMTNGTITGTEATPIKNLASIHCGHSSGNIAGCIGAQADTQADNFSKVGVIIEDVTADLSTIKSTQYSSYYSFGGVVGYANAIDSSSICIRYITVIGEGISYAKYFGGVVGFSSSRVEVTNIAISNTPVIEVHKNSSNIGGVIGMVSALSSDYNTVSTVSSALGSSNYGSIKIIISDEAEMTAINAGGLVGYGEKMKLSTNIYVEANLTMSTYDTKNYFGGLVGKMETSTIAGVNVKVKGVLNRDSSATDDSILTYAGGIVGYMSNSTIKTSVVTMNGKISGYFAGGVVGYAHTSTLQELEVKKNNVTCVIYGANAGGIVGYADQVKFNDGTFEVASEIQIESNFSKIGTFSFLGGIAGRADLTSDIDSDTIFTSGADVLGGTDCHAGGIFGCFGKGNIEGTNSNLTVTGKIQGSEIGYLIGYLYTKEDNITIKNVTVPNSSSFQLAPIKDVLCPVNVGGIIGHIGADKNIILSNLTNSKNHNFGDLGSQSNSCIGGIIGSIIARTIGGNAGNVSITDFSNSGSLELTMNASTTGRIGGLIGFANAPTGTQITLDGSVGTSKVIRNSGAINTTTKANSAVGGIIGRVENVTIIDPVNTGNITETKNANAGGIIGYGGGKFSITTTKSLDVNTGNISTSGNAGGIVGYTYGGYIIKGAKDSLRLRVGGAIGGNGACAGGIVGYNDNNSARATIAYITISSLVLSGKHVGGVIGRLQKQKLEINKVSLSSLEVNSTTDGNSTAGGVIGDISSATDLEISSVTIISTKIKNDRTFSGGFIGHAESSTITLASSDVKAEIHGTHAGGFAGSLKSTTLIATGSNVNSNSVIDGTNAAGGIVGFAYQINEETSFSDISVQNVTIKSSASAGGIFGVAELKATDYTNFGITLGSNTITGTKNAGVVMGSLTGYSKDDTTLTFNSSIIDTKNKVSGETLGSIAYLNKAKIIDLGIASGVTITFDGKSAAVMGSIVGTAVNSIIDNCDSYSPVIGSSKVTNCKIGGLVGQTQNVEIKNSNHYGNVKMNDTYESYAAYAGGIVGYTDSFIKIESCNNNGSVYSGSVAGGLVGCVNNSADASSIAGSNVGSDIEVVTNNGSSNRALFTGGLIGQTAGNGKKLSISGTTNASVKAHYINSNWTTETLYSAKTGPSGFFKWNLTSNSYYNVAFECFVGGLIGHVGVYTTIDFGKCRVESSDISAYVKHSSTAEESIGILRASYSYDRHPISTTVSATVYLTLWSGIYAGYGNGEKFENCSYDSSNLNARSSYNKASGTGSTGDSAEEEDWWALDAIPIYKNLCSRIVDRLL